MLFLFLSLYDSRMIRSSSGAVLAGLMSHPVPPIVIGFLLSFGGPEDLQIRFGSLILCVVWLLGTVWFQLPTTPYRNIVFALISGLSVVSVLAFGRMLMERKLHQQQLDAYKELTARVVTDIGEANILVAISNRGNLGLSMTAHCIPNVIAYSGGGSMRSIPPNPEFGYGLILNHPTGIDLLPGDTETIACLPTTLKIRSLIECADMTVGLVYSLANQSERKTTKKFRFVTIAARDGQVLWIEKPIRFKNEECKVTAPHPTE